MGKCGTGKDHCCWLGEKGKCPYVQESDHPDFNWACGLYVKYGSWEMVYPSKEYIELIKPFWDDYPIKNLHCGDWPVIGIICNDCKEVGHG